MIARPVGTRGTILEFDDGISVYYIAGFRYHLLCDTHLGPDSMDEFFAFIGGRPDPDQIIIFNSHSDWDHIWGNCAFPGSLIIGHEFCRQRMQERGEMDLIQNASQRRGPVRLIPPNVTFSGRITLEDEGIGFLYAPGHTIDSSVCYDSRDNILYLGDLVEDPIPYLDAEDLDTYLETLSLLLNHEASILVTAHSGIVSRDLISRNIRYVSLMRDKLPVDNTEYGEYRSVHQWNLNMRIIWEFLGGIPQSADPEHALVHILLQTGDLHEMPPGNLSELLESYKNGYFS